MSSSHPFAASLQLLFSAHHRWLTGRLLRQADDRYDAEDVCAETFFQLVAGRTDPRGIVHPRAFLLQIGQRVLYRRYRQRLLERAMLESLASAPEALAPSPEEQALLVEAIVQLDQALYGLPGAAREAFLYNQIDGLGYEEIAQRLQVSTRTVARYMKQALQCCLRNGFF